MKKIIIRVIAAAAAAIIAAGCLAACQKRPETGDDKKAFTGFEGQTLDGEKVDQTIFSSNKITVLNFWFNDCSACVSEIPELEELNKKLKEMGCELVGVSAEKADDAKAVEKAKEILEKQGGSYRNILVTGGDPALAYINNLVAYPTTVLADSEGNLIGEPISGALNSPEAVEALLNRVKEQIK